MRQKSRGLFIISISLALILTGYVCGNDSSGMRTGGSLKRSLGMAFPDHPQSLRL